MKSATKPRVKKTNINREAYLGLRKMLDSSSIEDNTVALSIINNLDFDNNKIPILLLYRAYQNDKVWGEYAGRIMNKINVEKGIVQQSIDYCVIHEIIKKQKLIDEESIYMEDLRKYNLKAIQQVFPFIRDLTILI